MAKSVRSLRHTRKPTELRSFIGLCNVYRRFIRNYADLVFPFYGLLQGKPPTEFPKLVGGQDASFIKQIGIISNPPVPVALRKIDCITLWIQMHAHIKLEPIYSKLKRTENESHLEFSLGDQPQRNETTVIRKRNF